MFCDLVYSSKPFGFRSFEKGEKTKKEGMLSLLGSKGTSYVNKTEVTANIDLIDDWKVIMSKTSAEHAGQSDKDGRKRILSRVEILAPGTICSESYLLVYTCKRKEEAENVVSYMKTQFFRFLLSSVLLTQNIAKDKFCFIPVQDFTRSWTDNDLYEKYNLSEEEIAFIDSLIRPID